MIDKNYSDALKQAKENLKDLEERGEEAISDEWEEVRKKLFTDKEIAESDSRVAAISDLIKIRQELGINQSQFEDLMKIQKLLSLSGKRLAVVSI